MPNEPRAVHAPRHGTPRALGAILPPLVRPVLKKRAPSIAALLADWEAVAGPAIAAVALPRRLAAGTLTLACSPTVALELQHLAPQLLQRINTFLGTSAVARLRFAPDTARAPARPPPAPPRAVPAEVAAAVAALPSGELRQALAALGAALAGHRGMTGNQPPPPSTRPRDPA